MTDDPERAVRQYIAKNPDAGVLDVISDFVVGPDHRDLVEEIVAERGAQDGDGDIVESDTNQEESTEDASASGPVARASGQEFYPAVLRDREWWVDWVLAKRIEEGDIDWQGPSTKQPVAPYREAHVRPLRWNSGLDEEEYPATDFKTAERFAGLTIGLDIPRPERVVSDEVKSGIIIPVGQPNDERRTVLLIDWDDVRDPETGAIHPVAASALEQCDGYAEISQSGEGIHQFVFGEIPGGLNKFIRHLDDEPFVGDDLPQLEMYQSGRLCAMTGRHVAGSGEDVVEGQDLIDELCWRFGRGSNNSTTTPSDPFANKRDSESGEEQGDADTPNHEAIGEVMREALEYDGPDPDTWEFPEDWSLGYAAVLRARERSDELPNTANWELIGYAAGLGHRDGRTQDEVIAHLEEHPTPQYGFDRSRAEKEVRAVYRKASADNYHPPSRATLVHRGLLPDDVVEADPAAGTYGQTVEPCAPPNLQRQPFDSEDRHSALEGERFDAVEAADGPMVWGDAAGAGKTTSAARAADARSLPHAVLFDKHRKALEFREDPNTPDDYYHLKGAEQKREDACMRADHADAECDAHGHPSHCPSMCPMYDLPPDHEMRQRYETLVRELGPAHAHRILGEDLPEHDEDGDCPWRSQFDHVGEKSKVVGVHEYQTLASIRDGRQVIVDESPRTLADARTLDTEALSLLGSRLRQLGRNASMSDNLRALGRFAHRIRDVLTDDPDAPETLAELEPPDIECETITIEVDPDNPPTWADPDEIRTTTRREPLGMPGEGYRERTAYVSDRNLLAEALARAKLTYSESTVRQMARDEWNGAPLAVDALLAVAADSLEAKACHEAIAAPTLLDGDCPRCGASLGDANGRRVCDGDDTEPGCGWDEADDYLVPRDAETARAHAYRDGAWLQYESLPSPSELPRTPLVLDATATREKVAGLYGVDPSDVTIDGDEPVEANLHTTQVLDGQYHYGTIRDSETAQRRIEDTVANLNRVHDDLLVLGRRDLFSLLDLPDDIGTLHYHGARGLNRTEFDAVVCIGAPHPDVEDLRREADLLAQASDLRVGGAEHSTRRDAPNPPIYRKLLYEDSAGEGRAVATKHYTGLTGALFRESREKELVQAVHRIRPLLAEEQKHAYLLTNVPTTLSIDEVVGFDELAEPLRALLPVDDRALDLAATVRDLAAGEGPNGFRADQVIETVGGEQVNEESARFRVKALHRLARLDGLMVSERTVRRWVADLEAVGLLDAGKYEPQRGVPYTADTATLTAALSVLSHNEGVEVALKRRIASLAESAGSAGDWIREARDLLGLAGDRVNLDQPVGPPPDPT